jgi:hypothetical protein
MRIDNVTLRRIIKEEVNNVMMEMNAPKPDPDEVKKFMQTQQEGAAALMLFSSMFGQVADKDQNIQSPDQIQGITVEIDGDDVNVPLKALNVTADFLQKKADSGDSTAAAGLESMNDLAKAPIKNLNSFGTADADGDGYLSSDVSGGFSLGNDEGGIYTQEVLKLVIDHMSQADAPTQAVDAEQPETTRSGSSTNADAMVKMLEIQPNKAEAAKKAKFLLQKIESGDAGVKATGDTVKRLKAVANQ